MPNLFRMPSDCVRCFTLAPTLFQRASAGGGGGVFVPGGGSWILRGNEVLSPLDIIEHCTDISVFLGHPP